MTDDIRQYSNWIGRIERASDVVSESGAVRLAATLDRDLTGWPPGTVLPELWHWAYAVSACPQLEIGPDGHEQLGVFLPPVSLPRRMWAAGKLDFLRPLRIGDNVVRRSRIVDITHKVGRSGPLVFVQVRHDLVVDATTALTEEQVIVYRDAPGRDVSDAPPVWAPTDEAFARSIEPTAALLFRFSALTFNAHRIHYDRDYCLDQGYPGLVVHGPLIATLLVDLLHRQTPTARLSTFTFKAVRPLFDVDTFDVCGRFEGGDRVVRLWARDHEGRLAFEATASLL